MLSMTTLLMLDALGYCLPEQEAVWPPPGPLPPTPTLVVERVRSVSGMRLRTRAGDVPLRSTQIAPDQWLLEPAEPLPPGHARLVGGAVSATWEVGPADHDAPTWTGPPEVIKNIWFPSLCTIPPHLEVSVPLRSEAPLAVEVVARGITEAALVRRFPVRDGTITLGDGCSPAFPFPEEGATAELTLRAVDPAGRYSAPAALSVTSPLTPFR